MAAHVWHCGRFCPTACARRLRQPFNGNAAWLNGSATQTSTASLTIQFAQRQRCTPESTQRNLVHCQQTGDDAESSGFCTPPCRPVEFTQSTQWSNQTTDSTAIPQQNRQSTNRKHVSLANGKSRRWCVKKCATCHQSNMSTNWRCHAQQSCVHTPAHSKSRRANRHCSAVFDIRSQINTHNTTR